VRPSSSSAPSPAQEPSAEKPDQKRSSLTGSDHCRNGRRSIYGLRKSKSLRLRASRRPGRRRPACAASIGYRKPPSTIGKPSFAAWTSRMLSASRRWRTRTPNSRSCWPWRCSMPRLCASCSQKSGRTRRKGPGHHAPAGWLRPVGAAGLFPHCR
jgi:hypothetical protein